jgi:hypothetical protein
MSYDDQFASRAVDLLVPLSASEPDWASVVRDATRTGRRRQLWLGVAIAAAVGVAGAITGLRLAQPARASVPRAVYDAILLRHGVIRHVRVTLDGVTSDAWIASDPPYAIRVVRVKGFASEVTPCGLILYNRYNHTLSVNRYSRPLDLALAVAHTDPSVRFAEAYRSEQVRYSGQATYRETPAYVLVTGEHGFTVTYYVRRTDYTPLAIVSRRGTHVYHYVYSRFQQLPRNGATEHLLHIQAPAATRVIASGPSHTTGPCAGFDREHKP